MWQELVDEGTELVQVRTCERIGIARPPVTAHVLGSKHKKKQTSSRDFSRKKSSWGENQDFLKLRGVLIMPISSPPPPPPPPKKKPE